MNDFMTNVYPALVENRFHLIPAKWNTHSEQSMLAHILNGIFSIVRLFEILENEGQIFPDNFKRKVLCAVTVHDVLKHVKADHGDITLKEANEWVEKLLLKKICPSIDNAEVRAIIAAHMKWSKHKGAILTSDIDTKLLVMLNLADYLSSLETPERLDVIQRVLEEVNPNLVLSYHKVMDVRGYVTGFLHKAIVEELQTRYHQTPLLFFPNGIVYVGRKEFLQKMQNDLEQSISLHQAIFQRLKSTMLSLMSPDILRSWINPTSNRNFIVPTAFLFFPLNQILDTTRERCLEYYKRIQKRGWGINIPARRSERIKDATKAEIEINLTDEDELLAPYFRIITYILSEIEDVTSLEATLRLAKNLKVTLPLNKIQKYGRRLRTGAGFDDCRILAKYYIDTIDPQRKLNFKGVLDKAHNDCEIILKPYIGQMSSLILATGLERVWDEVEEFVKNNVIISGRTIGIAFSSVSSLKEISGGERDFCSLCTRKTKGAKQFIDFTKISSKIFTNWNPPWTDKEERKICGVCYLEFVFRNMFVHPEAMRNRDERAYLMIFLYPQYSFTADLWNILSNELQDIFQQPAINFSSRQASVHILEGGMFDPVKYEEFGSVFTIARPPTLVIPFFPPKAYTPGMLFIIWVIPKAPKDITETEKWFLATYFAVLFQQTLGVKVLITQNVYPNVRHGGEIKGVIRLISPHHSIWSIVDEDISLRQVENMTMLLSALWYTHTQIWKEYPEDKKVAHVIRAISTHIMPGSSLAMRYLRVKEGAVFPPRTQADILMQRACKIIDSWR